MKLPDFLNWPEFNSLRTSMRAALAEPFGAQIKIAAIELPVTERLRKDGIDVDIDEIRVLNDGTLAYKGHRVLLYIRDVSNYGDNQQMPRFHVTFCSTLEAMRRSKRFARYVVANRDDGQFQVNLVGRSAVSSYLRLNVCKNCLTYINWKDYRRQTIRAAQDSIVQEFSLAEFFTQYPRDLVTVKPSHTSDTAPLNDYPSNWAEVSQAARRAAQFRCNSCAIALPGTDAKYLHVHHKNGQKNDCHADNLEVLCIKCHADEPLHGHMKNSPDYHRFLGSFRR